MPTGTLPLLVQGAAVSLALAVGAVVGGTVLAIGLTVLAFSRLAALRGFYRRRWTCAPVPTSRGRWC